MTQFAQLELLYDQFFKLSEEIKNFIQTNQTGDALAKLKDKEKLFKQIISARKTVKCTDEEVQKLALIEEKFKEKEKENLEFFSSQKREVAAEIKNTKQKTKITFAYKKILRLKPEDFVIYQSKGLKFGKNIK